jgi:conjugative transfer pilus assembly protein TraH
MKKIILALSLVFSASTVVHAGGWVDDWLIQSSSTSSGYFEGQQRGYYSAGSFHGRWKNTAEYPVTLEPPRVKSGCGGIDVFMGGYSFMDSDYLSTKLQSILTNAAGVAFDLALKTLCEQCSNTIKNMESISDTLNGMQIDECAAGKELVGIVADDKGIRSAEAMQERLGTAIKENKLVTGASSMWDKLTKIEKANNGQVAVGDAHSITASCPNELKNIFLADKTLLGSMGGAMLVPNDYLDLMRGLLGDVKLEGAGNKYKVSVIPPCPQNTPESLNSFLDGEIYVKKENGVCNQISDVNRDLVKLYRDKLEGIATKLKNNVNALSLDEKDFLDKNPMSPLPILRAAIATRTEGQAISGLANITARAMALQMVTDLYSRADLIVLKAQEVLEKKNSSTGDPSGCASYVFIDNLAEHMSSMQDRISKMQKAANDSYISSVNEMNTVLSYIEHMQKVESQMKAELSRRYSKDLVARLY